MHLDSIQNSVHEKCIGLGHDLKALPAVAEDLRAMAEHAKCQEAHLGENCNELHPTSEICAANTAKVCERNILVLYLFCTDQCRYSMVIVVLWYAKVKTKSLPLQNTSHCVHLSTF